MTTSTRPVAVADMPHLLTLVAEYWRFEDIAGFDAPRVKAELERLFGNPALGGGWIALADDKPAGYLLAVYVFSLEHLGLTAEIDEFFVLPSFRGRGIGSGLLKMAEREFVRRKCTNVSLQISHGNENARTFYRAHGYGERSSFELLDKVLTQA